MKPRTILVQPTEKMAVPSRWQVLPRAQNQGEEVRAPHQTIPWFAIVIVLGLTELACRKPADDPHLTVAQITQPQVENTAKGVAIKVAPAGQLADQSVHTQTPTPAELNPRQDAVPFTMGTVADRINSVSEPVTSGIKVRASSPPTQPAGAAKDSTKSQSTTGLPSDQAAKAQVARRDKHQGEPVSTGGKVGEARTPTAKATQAAKGLEPLPTSAENLASQVALAQVALSDKDWSVRMAAVEGLSNQGVLAQVAVSDEDVDIRKLAVSRLMVQAALAKVATSDNDWSVRMAATALLTEQGVLARIALADGDSAIRQLAVNLLTDQAALARVARIDSDWSVRRSAVIRLTSRSSLAQVATRDTDPDIRKLAVSRLKDQPARPEADKDH